MTTKEMDLAIGGMTCDHCVHHVGEALLGLDGVTNATVDLKAKSAHVTLDGTVEPDAIRNAARVAIAEIGYEVVS
jgi:copper chaperone CopZ